MSHSHDQAAQWAAENGFHYHEEVGSLPAENAPRIHAFHEYDELLNHVSGRFLGRDFHQIDVFERDFDGNTEATVLLIPKVTGSLPVFSLVPRSVTPGAKWLGIDGLAISTDAHTPPALASVIDEVKRHYLVNPGVFGEPMQEPADPAAVIATICKPEVLDFLSRHPGWFIESHAGLFTMWKPGRLMSGNERSEALELANELLELFDRADAAPPIPGVEMMNQVKPKQVLGTVIGVFGGFFVGMITFFTLLFFMSKPNFLGLVLVPLGMVVGGFLGNRIGRVLSN